VSSINTRVFPIIRKLNMVRFTRLFICCEFELDADRDEDLDEDLDEDRDADLDEDLDEDLDNDLFI